MTATVPPAPPYGVFSRRARLLIVDDQPSIIHFIHKIFEDEYDVFIAKTGEQALLICQETPPDLVLTDVMMPGMSGLELCKRLKQQAETADIPLIFVTGNLQPEDETACWNAGGVDFVNKPVNPTTLRNRVRAHLALKFHADRVHDLAFLDGLTGVANRRYFDERLISEWRRCCRSGLSLALIMLDIDYFKRFNERFGHQAGDDCLRRIGSTLKENLSRPYDLVARYDGEEFVCLLPETQLSGAIAIAVMLEDAVRQLQIEHGDSDVAQVITISLGVVSCQASQAGSATQLIEQAALNLQSAKQQGRGRLCAGVVTGAAK